MRLIFAKNMFARLNAQDRRTVRFGAIAAAAILIYVFVLAPGFARWSDVRSHLRIAESKLASIGLDESVASSAKRKKILAMVPVFETPQVEQKQRLLFEAKVNEQLKAASVQIKNMSFISGSKRDAAAGYKLLRLQCKGSCNFSQIVDFLANLEENPYLVGIEQMRIKCDEKKRDQLEVTLTLSTFAR